MRAWTGRIPEQEKEENHGGETERYAYVTVNGSVYHQDVNCSYIKLSIQRVSREDVGKLRSADGSKYYPCSCYKESPADSVYITKEGNRYHSSLECGSLKRSVKIVKMAEAAELRPCSKCGGE